MLLEAITINLFPDFGCPGRIKLHKPSIWGANYDSAYAEEMERHRGGAC